MTQSSLTSGSDATDSSSYATASISPTANRLVLLLVLNRKGSGTADTPTASGNGLTYVQVHTANAGGNRRLTLFRAMGGSPSAGAISIDFGGVTQTSCLWSVVEFDGVDTSGSNGSGAVVQVDGDNPAGSDTSVTITLAAFGSANNATYGGFSHNDNANSTAGSGFTAIHNVNQAENSSNLFSEWRADNDTTVDATWGSSVGGRFGIAAEIKAAGGAAVSAVAQRVLRGAGRGVMRGAR